MTQKVADQFELVVFSETLNQARQLMEPGNAVVVGVEIERTGEEVKDS